MSGHDGDAGLTRRESLLRFAGAAALVSGVGAWRLATAAAAGSGTDAVSRGLVQCVLTPELTEGLYYVSGEKLRRDVTEGKPGVGTDAVSPNPPWSQTRNL